MTTSMNDLVAKHADLVADFNSAWSALCDARDAWFAASTDFGRLPAAPSRFSGRPDLHADARAALQAAMDKAWADDKAAGALVRAAGDKLDAVGLNAITPHWGDRSGVRFLPPC